MGKEAIATLIVFTSNTPKSTDKPALDMAPHLLYGRDTRASKFQTRATARSHILSRLRVVAGEGGFALHEAFVHFNAPFYISGVEGEIVHFQRVFFQII